jgi:hypothetical protein
MLGDARDFRLAGILRLCPDVAALLVHDGLGRNHAIAVGEDEFQQGFENECGRGTQQAANNGWAATHLRYHSCAANDGSAVGIYGLLKPVVDGVFRTFQHGAVNGGCLIRVSAVDDHVGEHSGFA